MVNPKSQAKIVARELIDIFLRVKRLNREILASIYLRGYGIEIGALNSPLKIPSTAKVRYLDRMTLTDLRKHYPELKSSKLVNVDIVDNGETLATIQDSSLDFVIANHFLEHCENPINAVFNIFRVLREGGILYLALPDKRYTFDKQREITTFEHLVRDCKEGPQISRKQHLRDWVVHVENLQNEEKIQDRINELDVMNYSIHYHVWTQKEMYNFLNQLNEEFGIPFEVQLSMKHGIEVIFIIMKHSISKSL